MLAPALPLIVACLFAAVLDFAAHRGSICVVRASSEVLSARTIHMLWSIGKSMLWVILLTLPFFLVMPMAARGVWLITGAALSGGLAFGFGAAIKPSVNRLVTSCPYSAPHVEAPDRRARVDRHRSGHSSRAPSGCSLAGRVFRDRPVSRRPVR